MGMCVRMNVYDRHGYVCKGVCIWQAWICVYGCVYIMASVGMCVYDRRGYVSKDVCKLWQAWIYMDVGLCG